MEQVISFYSKTSHFIYNNIPHKIALILNYIKINISIGKIGEVEKGIHKILTAINYNPSSNSIIEIPFILKLILYYFLVKENTQQAITLIKTRKLSDGWSTLNQVETK